LKELINIFSNRELATVIWIVVFLIITVITSSIRRASGSLLNAFFSWKIQKQVILSALYSSLIIYLLERLGYWNFTMLKDTIFWFFFSALIVLYKAVDKSKEERVFYILFSENIKVILIVEFIVNLHNFHLIFEIFIIPIAFLLTLLDYALEKSLDKKYKISFATTFTGIIALLSLTLTVIEFFANKENYIIIDTLKSFLSPIIYASLLIPWAYFVAVLTRYETVFVMIDINLNDNMLKKFAKRRLVKKAKLSLKRLNYLSTQIPNFYPAIKKNEIIDLLK